MQDFDQFLGSSSSCVITRQFWVNEILADMVLDLGGKPWSRICDLDFMELSLRAVVATVSSRRSLPAIASIAFRMRFTRTCWIWIRAITASHALRSRSRRCVTRWFLVPTADTRSPLRRPSRGLGATLRPPLGHELAKASDDLACPDRLVDSLADPVRPRTSAAAAAPPGGRSA